MKAKFGKLIPEAINDHVWNFKIVGETESSYIIQAFVAPLSFYKFLTKSISASGITVEITEPVSYALL